MLFSLLKAGGKHVVVSLLLFLLLFSLSVVLFALTLPEQRHVLHNGGSGSALTILSAPFKHPLFSLLMLTMVLYPIVYFVMLKKRAFQQTLRSAYEQRSHVIYAQLYARLSPGTGRLQSYAEYLEGLGRSVESGTPPLLMRLLRGQKMYASITDALSVAKGDQAAFASRLDAVVKDKFFSTSAGTLWLVAGLHVLVFAVIKFAYASSLPQ